MKKGIRCLVLLCLLVAALPVAWGDEEVRRVQEELRKRNLYFGDINGQKTPGLAEALKRYQARKGFTPSGAIDDVTAYSLNVRSDETPGQSLPPLPDVPILKSDFAQQIPEGERLAREKLSEKNPDLVPTPPPPAESPPPSQDLSPQRVTALVESYLRASETDDIKAQTASYFSYPVKYFDHGVQGATFVERDVGYYLRQWPERRYTLLEPVTFAASDEEGATIIQFKIAYDLRNSHRHAVGRTNNFWTIRPQDGQLRIIAIQEARLRE